jgi:hypothetical protein
MDPRVKTPMADLAKQFELSKQCYDQEQAATVAIHEITVVRDQLRAKGGDAATTLMPKLNAIAGGGAGGRGGGGGRGAPAGPPSLNTVRAGLSRMQHSMQNADEAPTTAQIEAYNETAKPLAGLLQQWNDLKKSELTALNRQLEKDHQPAIAFDRTVIDRDVMDQIQIGNVP